jgi:hypothetical protein
VSTQAPTQSLRARRRCRIPTDGAIDVAGFLQKVCDATPPPHSGIELFAPTTRRWSKCGNAIVLPGKRCAQAIDVMVDCLRPWRVPWGVCRPDIRVMMCFRNHNRAQREFGEQPTKRTPMVKKFGLHHLTVSDLAAAPSHSLHRTLAALPGPGSAHHVALSSPRRRRSPGARCVGSCWLRLEVVLPGEDHPQLRLARVHHDRDRLRQRCRGWVRGAGKRHGRTANRTPPARLRPTPPAP